MSQVATTSTRSSLLACRFFFALCLLVSPRSVLCLIVFTPNVFTILRKVGQLSVSQEVEWQYYQGGINPVDRDPLDVNQPARTKESNGQAVRLFQASMYAGRQCLLKEFMPIAREVGENELAAYKALYGDSTALDRPNEFGLLLGHMESDAAFDDDMFKSSWVQTMPDTPPPTSGNLWLVFAWQPFYQTIGSFPSKQQEPPWFDFDGSKFRAERERYCKVVAARCLQVLAKMHQQGVVHQSLGPSSFMLSTADQNLADELTVSAMDLGFAVFASEEVARDEMAAAFHASRVSKLALNDLQCLGYVLIEMFLKSAAAQDAPDAMVLRRTDQQGLKDLIEDAFDGDVRGQFRNYCNQEPSWKGAVQMLDAQYGAGWGLIQGLINCRKDDAEPLSAQSLLESCVWFNE